jgi:hypothetical protein
MKKVRKNAAWAEAWDMQRHLLKLAGISDALILPLWGKMSRN